MGIAKWMLVLAVTLVCLGLPACGTARKEGEAPEVEHKIIEVSMVPKGAKKFEFAKPMDVTFIVTNTSDKAIVVLDILPITNRAENPVSLSGNAYGAVQKKPGEDVYEFDGMQQRATALAFYSGFLLPGQAITVSHRYRPVAKVEQFKARYVSADSRYDGTAKSLAPLNVYVPRAPGVGPHMTYVPFSSAAWIRMSDTSRETGQVGPGVPANAVLIPAFEPTEQKGVMVSIPLQYSEAGLLLESARATAARLAEKPEADMNLIYSDVLGGYLVLQNDYSWVLRSAYQNGRGDLLPPLAGSFVQDLDTNGKVRIRVGEKQEGMGPGKHDAGWKFWDKYPVIYGDGMYTRGEFIEIDKDNALPFLKTVREKSGKLKEFRYYFRSRYFILELPGKST